MATAARGVEAVAAAVRRAEAARLSATAATGVEAAAAAPGPSLSDLAEGERGANVRQRRGPDVRRRTTAGRRPWF
uniref:Uncharacterized protein n=1 Tax=Oryza rufipogon TaxID=4529 RepID=A0A0E0NIF9_ORYRU